MGVDDELINPEDEQEDYVPVVFAGSVEEAAEFEALLTDHDVPAVISSEEDDSGKGSGKFVKRRRLTHGVPVLVPVGLLDEASEIISDRENMNEYDENMDLDEEDEDDTLEFTEDLGAVDVEEEDDDEDDLSADPDDVADDLDDEDEDI